MYLSFIAESTIGECFEIFVSFGIYFNLGDFESATSIMGEDIDYYLGLNYCA